MREAMSGPRVLILYNFPGTGHESAAEALEEALRAEIPSAVSRKVDLLGHTNPLIERVVLKTFFSVLQRRPRLWGFFCESSRSADYFHRFRRFVQSLDSHRALQLLEGSRPDIVVCTQALSCAVVDDFKRRRGWTFPLVGVVTDFYAPPYWVFQEADLYCVPTESVREEFASLGVRRERMRITGIPISPKFACRHVRREILSRYRLDPALPVLLLMAGRRGIGPVAALMEALLRLPLPFQLVVVAGKNAPLLRRLRRVRRQCGRPVRLFGFTPRIDEIMETADLLLTKPGGMTVAEALSKGLPMVLFRPLPGQEKKNADFLIREETAIMASSAADAAGVVRGILEDGERLRRLRQNAVRLGRAGAARDVVQTLGERLFATVHPL